MTMTRILVPLDGSPLAETVLPYARQLAKGMHWALELLRVIEQDERLPQDSRAPTEEAVSYLHTVSRYLEGSGPTVTVKTRPGNAATEIIAEADQTAGTLTAMSTQGRTGLGRWLIGSVADKVLHGLSGPLLLIHPVPRSPIAPEPGLSAMLVPLDGSKLAEQVLPHVVNMARTMALPVRLVRATPSLVEYLRWSSTGHAEYVPDYSQVMAENEAAAREYLDKTSSRLRQEGVANVETRVVTGDAAMAITDMAGEREGSLVTMTTRGRTGLARTFLGSVADRVVRHCGAPVFLVKPT